MKNYITYLFILLCIAGCNKKDEYPDLPERLKGKSKGNISALMNGKEFSANYNTGIYIKDKISISGRVFKEGFKVQNLMIKDINPFLKRQRLFPIVSTLPSGEQINTEDSCDITLYFSDDDVGLATYKTANGADNYLEIASYNAETKEISGTFQVTLVVDGKKDITVKYDDTLRFTNGAFSIKLD